MIFYEIGGDARFYSVQDNLNLKYLIQPCHQSSLYRLNELSACF